LQNDNISVTRNRFNIFKVWKDGDVFQGGLPLDNIFRDFVLTTFLRDIPAEPTRKSNRISWRGSEVLDFKLRNQRRVSLDSSERKAVRQWRYIASQATNFAIACDVALINGAASRQYSYEKCDFFKQRMLSNSIIGVFGIICLIAGIWIIFFGIDRPRWNNGWRLGGALTLSICLIFLGWIIQVTVLLPKVIFAENASVFCGFSGVSATRYGRTEYVNVLPVVVAELKLGDVQRHVLGTDLMECADNAALHQRPKTFNRVRVDGANYVFLVLVPDEAVRIFLAASVASKLTLLETVSRINPTSVSRSNVSITRATTLPLRWTAPTTPILPEPGPPVPPLRLSQCLLRSLPPM
jgi:hypothetical protein